MSVIFASSTCDLNLKTLKAVGVEVIQLPITLNGEKVKYQAEKFDFDKYYANPNFEVDEVALGKLITKKLTEALNTQQDVLFLTPNAKYDATYKLANPIIKNLAKQFPNQKIEMVNCNNYGLGYGLIVYQTGIFNHGGESLTEVVKYVNKLKKEIKTYIVPSNIDKIKEKLNLIGGMIGVRPILLLTAGELKFVENVRGKKNIISNLASLSKLSTNSGLPFGIMSGKNLEDAEMLKQEISDLDSDKKIITSVLNPLLLNYFGDKTLMISFYRKSGK